MKIFSYAELLVALGIILFWAFFFWGGPQGAPPIACYLAFERAFPLPDLMLAFVLIIAAFNFLRNNQLAGLVLSVASGGALIFLGLLDVSFNLQQGVYTLSLSSLMLNVGINSVCIGFGLFSVVYSSKRVSL